MIILTRGSRFRMFLMFFWGISVLVLVWFMVVKDRRCQRMRCISFDAHDFQLKDVYEEKSGSVFRGLYTIGSKPDSFMRVDVREAIDTQTALDYIRGRVAGMKALYENIRSPYPGLLTNEIRCDEEFKPTYETFMTKQGIEVQEIVGYLNDRMTFGSCEKQQIHFKGMMLLFACPDRRQLYQIEFISPIDTYQSDAFRNIAQSVTCS